MSTKLDFRVRQNTPSTVLYNFNGLEVRADCDAAGAITLTFRTAIENSQMDFDTNVAGQFVDPNFDVGDTNSIPGIDQEIGQIEYTSANGAHVSIAFQATDKDNAPLTDNTPGDADPTSPGPLGGTADCFFAGIATTTA